MPTVNLKRDVLFKQLGKVYTDDDFAELCFSFGLELDEVTTERQMISKEQGVVKGDASDEVIYRVDIPANRYDLLCMEGLVRGLLIFLGKIPIPEYKVVPGTHKVFVKKSTEQIRPFTVAAILRGITFDPDRYNSFIDLQDKLHQNVCRKRTLVAIGTHDLDTIKGPFIYDAKKPEDIKFTPLKQDKQYNAAELMDLYSKDTQLKPYLPIIIDSPVFPVYYDANGVVMSMPPIINSEHSKITLNTKNVFIEMTATDEYKASLALDTLVCMFSEYTATPFTVESVTIEYEDTGRKVVYPQLLTRTDTITSDQANKGLGVNLTDGEVVSLLKKMGLQSKQEKDRISLIIPPTRQDILHACDIVEDVGIAYGYNNIPMIVPKVFTIGCQLPINKVTDQLRHELSRCGYTEALTFALCSKEDMEKSFRTEPAVTISNPKTLEFQIARTSLIAGLLKTILANKKMPLPLKVFEISDVVLKDKTHEVGARNERRLCVVHMNKTPGFEIIHGIMDRVMAVLEIPHGPTGYTIQAKDDETFLKGRCASILLEGKVIGVMGVLSPIVINNFELSCPASCVEVNMELISSYHLSHSK